jgi:transposase
MARPFRVEIQETAQELQQRLKRAGGASQIERLQMLWWLKTGQVVEHQQLALRLGRNGSTISRWLQKYRQGGLSELLAEKKAPGKIPLMSTQVRASLRQQLEQESGFSSYQEIVEWIEVNHGIKVKYATVYQWVRGKWGAKLKVPRPQSSKQDQIAVGEFKKTSFEDWQ